MTNLLGNLFTPARRLPAACVALVGIVIALNNRIVKLEKRDND